MERYTFEQRIEIVKIHYKNGNYENFGRKQFVKFVLFSVACFR